MWIERFGTVDESIFIAFGVVVGVIIIISLANVIIVCFTSDCGPGNAVSFLLDLSAVVIGAAVLFRGAQTNWGSRDAFRILCQVFTAEMLVGYTLYTSVICVRSWAFVSVFRYKKRSPSWSHLLSVSALLTVAAACVVVWELVFTPDVQHDMTVVTKYNTTVLSCQDPSQLLSQPQGSAGLTSQGSTASASQAKDFYQFCWRVASSAFFAAILLVSLLALPFLFTITLPTRLSFLRHYKLVIILININNLICVAIGLIVWFTWQPASRDVYVTDSYMYGVIGGLQLYGLVFTQAALFIAHTCSLVTSKCCCCKESSLFPRYGSSGRLINRELSTFDSRQSTGTLANLDRFLPAFDTAPQGEAERVAAVGGVAYVNVNPLTEADTNNRHFRY